jgi:hypothetical protein
MPGMFGESPYLPCPKLQLSLVDQRWCSRNSEGSQRATRTDLFLYSVSVFYRPSGRRMQLIGRVLSPIHLSWEGKLRQVYKKSKENPGNAHTQTVSEWIPISMRYGKASLLPLIIRGKWMLRTHTSAREQPSNDRCRMCSTYLQNSRFYTTGWCYDRTLSWLFIRQMWKRANSCKRARVHFQLRTTHALSG